VRSTFLIGEGTTLGPSTDGPLMTDAARWGDLVFLSGRAAVDPATGALRATGFAEQCRMVLDDIQIVLATAGSGPEHALRVECWLADGGDFAEWNAQYARVFPPPRPTRSTLVTGFAVPGLLIEVQVTAGIPS
jgi:2-iminobutanoate/2-iminopropanoate deaminase